MQIEQLIKEIQFADNLINGDPNVGDQSSRPSRELARNSMIERMPALQREYSHYLKGAAAAMVLQGDSKAQEDFAAIAEAEGNTITLDASELYRRLSEGIDDSMGASRQFGVTQMSQLVTGLRTIGEELSISSMDGPVFKTETILPDKASVVNHVRSLVRAAIGDSLNAMYLLDAATKKAMQLRYIHPVVPIVIKNAVLEEASTLGLATFSTSLNVNLPDQVEVDFVVDTFEKVRDTVAKQRKQQ